MAGPSTINDLPPEIIEQFTPPNSPETISSLKLVNRRFNEIFSQDKFYKHYLYYEEKCYLSDLKSNSTAVGVAEAVEEIKSGAVGKWKGYLKLQKAHLANWRAGRFNNFRRIDAPSFNRPRPENLLTTPDTLSEIYDDDGTHWFLMRNETHLTICNITASVQSITKTVPSESALMMPGQVLLSMDFALNNRLFYVYSFCKSETSDLNFDLQYKFLYDKDHILHDDSVLVQEGSHSFSRYFVVVSGKEHGTAGISNIFVCMSNFAKIHVWDLTSQSKIRVVSVRSHRVWHDFLEANRIIEDMPSIFTPGQFPNIVFHLATVSFTQLTVYNTLKDQVTHVIATDQLVHNYMNCSLNSNLLCLFEVASGAAQFSIYQCKSTVSSESKEPNLPVLLHSFDACISMGTVNRFDTWKTAFWRKTDDLFIQMLTMDDRGIQKHQLPYDEPYNDALVGFIRPDLLLVHSGESRSLKVINTLNGNLLFEFEGVRDVRSFPWHLTFPIVFYEYYKCLRYPSKIVLIINNEYRIYYM